MRIVPIFCVLALGCARMEVRHGEWLQMGTVAKVEWRGDADMRGMMGEVKAVYDEVERKYSIWRKDSEILRYDDRSMKDADPYRSAFRIMAESGGAFNPFWRGRDKCPDLGAIAKGFAVDEAAGKIGDTEHDVLLDLGGNLKVVKGIWRTGIRDPNRQGEIAEVIVLSNSMACATSGEYERGKHIYDGRTGLPVSNAVASVTVVHPTSAMIADGLSTTLFVLGKQEGERFLKKHYPEARAVWIMKDWKGQNGN